MSTIIGRLITLAREEYLLTRHSNDQTGGADEIVPDFVKLVREYDMWKIDHPSVNTQQQAARITNAVVQRTLMDNHPPSGEDSDVIRSQIGVENGAVEVGDNRMETLLGAATIVGIVEDAGVPLASVPHVSAATSTVVAGTLFATPRVNCRDLLSHIERSRNRQSAGIAEALGSVLNTIFNPPRTLRDLSTDFDIATRNFRTAVC